MKAYRFFERLPAIISFTAVGLVVVPFIDARWAAFYVLAIGGLTFVRAIRGAVDVARGFVRYRRSARVDWNARLVDLERAMDGLPALPYPRAGFRAEDHAAVVDRIREDPASALRPSELLHAVVIAAYNEPYPVIADTIRTLLHTSTSPRRLIIFFAYEERGGPVMAETARRLAAEYGHRFGAVTLVEHRAGVPGEIAGKGANITHAGHRLAAWVSQHGIEPEQVIVTSLDCDNIPHESCFDAVAYEYATAADRPVCPSSRSVSTSRTSEMSPLRRGSSRARTIIIFNSLLPPRPVYVPRERRLMMWRTPTLTRRRRRPSAGPE